METDLKSINGLFKYFIREYCLDLRSVETQNGIQKRLKSNELEQELRNYIKEYINVKDLFVELKLGPAYNRIKIPWIQVFSKENRSGAKGRYIGITFSDRDSVEEYVEIWIGFGKTKKRQVEIYELEKQYKTRYALIEPKLKYGFSYNTDCYSAIIISKRIDMRRFEEREFKRDLEYITNLYKEYEVRFENVILPIGETKEVIPKQTITYEEINKKMLSLIEEVGNLAKAIKELEDK